MKAISSMATRHVLADSVAAAASAGLPPVEVESVGGVDAAARVSAGEQFDLVFLAEGALRTLADGGFVDAGTLTPLVVSQVAVAVPASGEVGAAPEGAAFPDAAGVRDAIRDSRRIGYSTGPSGTALLAHLTRWELCDAVGDRLVQARPGVPVARLLADGEVDLGFQQLSELVGQPGIRILGTLPADCAIDTVFAGAVAAASGAPADARDVLAFLASAEVRAIARAHHFQVP